MELRARVNGGRIPLTRLDCLVCREPMVPPRTEFRVVGQDLLARNITDPLSRSGQGLARRFTEYAPVPAVDDEEAGIALQQQQHAHIL